MAELLHGELTEKILGAAFEVHSELGPGYPEKAYENALAVELARRGVTAEQQAVFPLFYKGVKVAEFKVDLLAGSLVVVELKATTEHDTVFEAQVLSYLKGSGKRVGLLELRNGELVSKAVCSLSLHPCNPSNP